MNFERVLFHYTSYEALISILTSCEIWASNVHYLNDGSEFAYAIRLARGQLWLEMGRDAARAQFLEIVRGTFDSYDRLRVFVASFSADGDLLSQWRAYCPAGQGVSIGIGQAGLARAAESQGFRLIECLYDPAKQQQIVTTWLRNAVNAYDSERPGTTDEMRRLAQRLVYEFTVIAPEFKDPAFREEYEWRVISDLVSVDECQIGYRSGRSFIVPYFKLRLPTTDGQLDIARFIVGPTPHPELASSALGSLANARGVKWGQTVISQVPYRTW